MHDATVRDMTARLEAALPGSLVHIRDGSAAHAGHAGSDGGGHFRVSIGWPGFATMSRLERQRHINTLLADMLADGRIHALALSLSPETA